MNEFMKASEKSCLSSPLQYFHVQSLYLYIYILYEFYFPPPEGGRNIGRTKPIQSSVVPFGQNQLSHTHSIPINKRAINKGFMVINSKV